MCLIVFRFAPGEARYLTLAANRDEFHERPTEPMHWWRWPEGPLAGRDERAGGTWLALARDGRFAAVTNFRDTEASGGGRSRGDLPVGFLAGDQSPQDYAAAVHTSRDQYGPFNLLVGDRDSLWYASSHATAQAVGAGTHALSNGVLDADWPKSRRAVAAIRGEEKGGGSEIDPERFMNLMNDRRPAPDERLPDTGVGAELEQFLSPPFIVGERYGTRSTTVVALSRSRGQALERNFDASGEPIGESAWSWSP